MSITQRKDSLEVKEKAVDSREETARATTQAMENGDAVPPTNPKNDWERFCI